MKITGLKKAVGTYKRVNAGGYYSSHYGNLMYDKTTGKLWCDEYCDWGRGDCTIYRDKNIVNLSAAMDNCGIDVNMQNVKQYITSNFN